MNHIVLIGSSGHAKVVADIVALQGKYKIAGLLDDYRGLDESSFGYPIIGKIDDLPRLTREHQIVGGIIAVGDNWGRSKVAEKICSLIPGFEFITAIHPSAQCAQDVSLGRGTVIMAGAVVNPGSRIEEFCILNTNATLDHDCHMDRFSSLAPAAATGGKVNIGAFSAICIGASIAHSVEIGAHTVVGAGAVVLESLPAEIVAYGVPARVIRKRTPGDSYL